MIRHLLLSASVPVLVAAICFAGCLNESHVIQRGDIVVELSQQEGLSIHRGKQQILRSHSGDYDHPSDDDRTREGEAYAPFAAATTETVDVQEVFGFFDFHETIEPFEDFAISEVRASRGLLRFKLGDRGSGAIRLKQDGSIVISWTVPDRDRLAMTFRCTDGERFFAMGAQVSSEHRGFRVPVWTQEQGVGKSDRGQPPAIFGLNGAHYDAYAPVPFALSSKPYGMWLDSSYRSEFEFCQVGKRLRVETLGPRFRLRIFPSGSIKQALQDFTAVTGRPDPVSRWTFAPWADVFGGPAAISQALQTLRSNKIPASVIWAEDWVGTLSALGGENLTYDWREDPQRFPDLAAVADEIHRRGMRFLVYINPFVPNDADVYLELQQADVLVKDAQGQEMELSFPFGATPAYFDPTAQGALPLFGEIMERAVDQGVDGWMADYGEALPYHAVLANGQNGSRAHNLYPLLWARASKQFWQQHRPGDHAFFSRSGFTGIAAATHIHWLGDQMTSFDRNDGLGSVIPLYLSAGLSGIALTHSDVGGYTSVGTSVRSYELWARWLELEAFTPFLRMHHSSDPANNIQWHSDPSTLALFKKYARWHQRLLPYFAQVSNQATQGIPAVRPVWWGDESQEALFDVDDAFLCGDDLLVAPILAPGQTSRQVKLPRGQWRRWIDLFGPFGPVYPGNNTVEVEASIEEPIVFVRAGAVLPLLAAYYDSMATARPDIELDPGVLQAPDQLQTLLLQLLGGGGSTGEVKGYGLPELRWQWQGEAAPRGPLESVRLEEVTLPVCESPRQNDCVQDQTARIAERNLDGRAILITASGATGTLRLWGEGTGVVVSVH